MLREAWTLAIETLSWIELQRLGERLALNRATKQLRIKDFKAIGLAHRLVSETLRRKNYIDFLLNSVLAPKSLNDLKLGPRAFLRDVSAASVPPPPGRFRHQRRGENRRGL